MSNISVCLQVWNWAVVNVKRQLKRVFVSQHEADSFQDQFLISALNSAITIIITIIILSIIILIIIVKWWSWMVVIFASEQINQDVLDKNGNILVMETIFNN